MRQVIYRYIICLIIVAAFSTVAFFARAATEDLSIEAGQFDKWRVEGERGTEYQILSDKSERGPFLKLEFVITEGNWIQISQRGSWDLRGMKYARFYYRATGETNNLQFKLVDKDKSTFGINIPGALPCASWTQIDIPLESLEYFWGGDDVLDLSDIRTVYIALTKAQGGEGTLSLEDVVFTSKSAQGSGDGAEEGQPLITMDTTVGWSIGGESGSSSNLGTSDGKVGRALRIDYDFGTGTWIQIQRKTGWDLTPFNHMSFWVRAEGERNNVQIKMMDADKSTFGVILEGKNLTNEWQEIKIPFMEFNHFWGGDNILDWKEIQYAYFAITKDKGGSGVVFLDDCKFFYEALPDEIADEPKAKIHSVYSVEGLDLHANLNGALQWLNKPVPEGLKTSWGAFINSTILGQEGIDSLNQSNDVALDNMLNQIEIGILLADKDMLVRLIDIVFSENYFFDLKIGLPVWLLDSEGHKKSLKGDVFLSPLSESLRLIKLLYASKEIIGEQSALEHAKKLLPVIDRAFNDNLLMPLWIWTPSGTVGKLAQSQWTLLDFQDPAAFYLLGHWLGQDGYDARLQNALEIIERAQMKSGFFKNRVHWEDQKAVLGIDRERLSYQIISNLNIALNLLEYQRINPSEATLAILRRFLDRLMASISVYDRVYASYDPETGVVLTNYDAISIYSKMVRLALGLEEYAIAEHLIKKRILPAQNHEGVMDGIFEEDLSGFFEKNNKSQNILRCQTQQNGILAMQYYQNVFSGLSLENFNKYHIEFDTPAFFDSPYEIIYLEDLFNQDSISAFGEPDGNFDGVGFSFAAASFPPSHTLCYSLDKSMFFLVP
ncbi:MAG: carbohydrate binding domain-containing protein, partial [Chlamydiota bacterium]|nr:carbohydrate binding domain-containing protein [Chlamydiota bacterium]